MENALITLAIYSAVVTFLFILSRYDLIKQSKEYDDNVYAVRSKFSELKTEAAIAHSMLEAAKRENTILLRSIHDDGLVSRDDVLSKIRALSQVIEETKSADKKKNRP